MFRLFDFNILTKMPSVEETYLNAEEDEEEEETPKYELSDEFVIQMFGVNEMGETCCGFVTDYRPFFYVLVKDDWTISKKNEFIQHLKNKMLSMSQHNHRIKHMRGWSNGNSTDFDSVVPGSSPGPCSIF